MSQLPAEHLPFSTSDSDTRGRQDDDLSPETLPSATVSSGLTPAMRQQLEEQFRSSGGNVDALAGDLRQKIAELDQRAVAEDDPQHTQVQAQRALYVAQLSYLEDHLAVHGVDLSRGTRSDWDDNSMARSAGEPMTGTMGTSGRRRVRVYDSTR